MYKKKQYLTLISVAAGILWGGCIVDQSLPDLGECADTAGLDVYEYGQVGIGTCLAGPTDMKVLPHPDQGDDFYLLVSNTNFERNFDAGSLLAIPFSGLDMGMETNYMHQVGAVALPIESFPGGFDMDSSGEFALISDRQADKLMGELTDRVYPVDLRGLALDEPELAYADSGPEVDEDGNTYISVPTDPYAVVAHEDTALFYVLALTTHQVTVLDASGDLLRVVDVVGSGDVSDPVFEDLDGSGSHADFHLDGFGATIAEDETWEIRYLEGSYSLYYTDAEDGFGDLNHMDSADTRNWYASVAEDLTSPGEGDWSAAGYGRGSVTMGSTESAALRRLWVEGIAEDGTPSIGASETVDGWSLNWYLGSLADPVLSARGSGFEELGVGDPWVVVDEEAHLLYYTAYGAEGRSLGLATGDGYSFSHGDEAIVSPSEDGWDSEEVYGPSAYRWALTGQDLVYYTGTDGTLTGIGLAIGEDGSDYQRYELDSGNPGLIMEPGEIGSWDSVAVAYPAVLQDAGMFHMFYAGSDGNSWGLGHATSFDGIAWQRDPLNPVETGIADGTRPPVVGAVKVSEGDYFRVEGEFTGNMAGASAGGSTVALPGESFVNSYCPIAFTIVDRHLLGRGNDGEAWEDGSGAPSVIPEGDGSYTMYYETVEDGQHLLGEATSDDGLSFERNGAVSFAGADTGDIADLDGARAPSVMDVGGARMLAFYGWVGSEMSIFAAVADPGPGATFTPLNDGQPVLQPGAEESWDESGVASPSLVQVGDETWMFYQGDSSSTSRVGAARYDEENQVFVRVAGDFPEDLGLVLDRGGVGDWDDDWVGTPDVRVEEDGTLAMLYSASDSVDVLLGLAHSTDGITWERAVNADGVPAAILGPDDLSFDLGGCTEPQSLAIGDELFMWYEGIRGSDPATARIGAASSHDGQTWVKVFRPLQAGDGYVLQTEAGDTEAASSIDLGDDITLIVDGQLIHGSGVTDLGLSPDGKFLFVTNKMYDNIYVLDVWDDSSEGYVDTNYHGIEAVIQMPNRYAVTGTRGMAFSDDGKTMYVLLAPMTRLEDPARRYGTEAVLVLDISPIEDDSEAQIYSDLVIGYAATARGVEEDEGNPSVISGGPTNLVLSPSEDMAYVAHYNDNSVHVYRLDLGRDPVLIDVIEGMGDEPFDVALSPDGKLLFVANYVGELEGPTQNVVHSTITVIDVDEESPTYHQILTTLRNRDAW